MKARVTPLQRDSSTPYWVPNGLVQSFSFDVPTGGGLQTGAKLLRWTGTAGGADWSAERTRGREGESFQMGQSLIRYSEFTHGFMITHKQK